MTLGTGHYSSGGGGGLEENIGGARLFVVYEVGGLCFSYHCLSVAFKNLKRKIMLLNKKLTAENAAEVTKLHSFFKKSFPEEHVPGLDPHPLAPLKLIISIFSIK